MLANKNEMSSKFDFFRYGKIRNLAIFLLSVYNDAREQGQKAFVLRSEIKNERICL
jgi:hypothetical protein